MTNSKASIWLVLAGLLCACKSGGDAADMAPPREMTDSEQPGRDVDVLFVIDNSPSTSEWQHALAAAIPRFIKRLDSGNFNYQIGVATSDVGSWTAKDTPWSVTLGSCNSFEGDDGLLQRTACNTRSGVTQSAVDACQALCPDPKFVPADHAGFIRKLNGVSNVPVFLDPMTNQDIGPQKAFQCIALVGDNGCGIEGPFEGARRALDGHLPANRDFLRPGSLLSLIFLTDEDDCSVSLAGRPENDPATRDCAAPDQDASADCFNTDYRCLARSTRCNEPLNTAGVKTGCQERPSSYLEPVQNYVDFIQRLRPAKKLLVAGIYARTPVNEGGKFIATYQSVGHTSPELNRALGTDAACSVAQDPNLGARPQHRLSKFTRSFANSLEFDVCDPAGYGAALEQVVDSMQKSIAAQ